ncbi:DUF6807 family protein [Microbacterium karelineae]|uniref:DUF6807 family protein n=1 Tax=Microbacterium karelineae TaxID=2654283 RepID=UPI0012E9CD17|nr:DUF6807 family protein [Microbacterium karelineae]
MRTTLLGQGDAVVAYDDGADVAPVRSPRPFLVATSRGGAPVTDVGPDDHLHHLGLSAALPDVDGTSFWGGRTYVRGRGSTLLDNHGAQRVVDRHRDGDRLTERIEWCARRGGVVLDERRSIVVRDAEGGREIVWVSELEARDGDVTFGSPQTNGRDGAFYGGLFWRTPFTSARLRSADGAGEAVAHGSRSPWLAVDGVAASLVAATTATDMPWFVRATGYVGFGPAVAVDDRRILPAGQTLRLDLAVAILDGAPSDPAAVAAGLIGALDPGVALSA